MTRKSQSALIALLLVLMTAGAGASTLTGSVRNGTTGKPSSGDEVILIKLGAGMEEAGHAQTDYGGQFSLPLPDEGMHLVRVVHQGVTYHQPAPPGTHSVEVEVYDVSPKVEGVKAVADLMQVQAARGDLLVTRLFAVDNRSEPRRTQMNDSNFEFYAPENAEITEAQAQTAGGQWVNTQPAAQREKGLYAFVFPLRPGQTLFRVTYRLPYSGKATIEPKLVAPLEHFVAIVPRSLSFAANRAGAYQEKQAPDLPNAVAEIAGNPKPGQNLAFEIQGEGTLESENQNASNQGDSSGMPQASADNRPGGGLGTPGDDPDPMDPYRWWLLGGFAMVLTGAAVYISSRSHPPLAETVPAEGPSSRSATLLEAFKEELFQLEMDHQQGKISREEYTTAKAGLDQALGRTLKRKP
ncbi:MAG: hypothetical protein J2P13_09290 [Acidobacteria bacterium]|nr:hypothetical protein [Acidobacteriota bacterium]